MTGGQDGDIVTRVALDWSDVTDAAVAMFVVLPSHKVVCPSAGRVEIGKSLTVKDTASQT